MPEQPVLQTPDTWDSITSDYEAMFAPFSSAVATLALRKVGPLGCARLLDVAAGTGALALQAAAAGAKVTAVDFSGEMLGVLRRKTGDKMAIQALVMDGQALDLPDETFDLAASNMGVVLFPDPAKALAEMLRVMKAGARAVVSTVKTPDESPLMQTIFRALHQAGLQPEAAGVPTFQTLSKRDRLEAAFESTGFERVSVETVTVPWTIASPKEFWNRWATVAPPIKPLFSHLPKDRLDAAGDEFSGLVRETHGAGAVTFPTEVLLGFGSRPES